MKEMFNFTDKLSIAWHCLTNLPDGELNGKTLMKTRPGNAIETLTITTFNQCD